MAVLQHEHSLSLIDLNPKYPHDEQVYDDEEDLIIIQAFQSPCNRCHEKITYFHRYCYKCDECGYLLHKLCAELPTQLEHASHGAHTLTLFLDESHRQCYMCKSVPRYNQLCYHCSQCNFNICLDCGMDRIQYHSIYHPSHIHPLTPMFRNKEILAECDACGKKHFGVFYLCATCFLCYMHIDCIFQPKRLLIQDGTRGQYSHTHRLLLTYSFPKVEQEARFNPLCRVCDDSFSNYEKLWVYKCDRCRYYVHVHCASLRHKPTNSGSITSNYHEDDPKTVHLPLPDRTYNVIRNLLLKEANKAIITHDSHEHPLTLMDAQTYDITTSTDKYLGDCEGCRSRIRNMPYYKCTNGCDFHLHDWCTQLPTELKDHRVKRDPFFLLPKRNYYVDDEGYTWYMNVVCAIIPLKITHPSHPNHILISIGHGWLSKTLKSYCRICLSGFTGEQLLFSCSDRACHFHLHLGCAMLLPTTIKHKYDKHPMTISYRPIEDHDGDYFCEVCEEELNPYISFYHCRDCAQSMHTACAPLLIPLSIIQKINFSVHEKMILDSGIYYYYTKHHEGRLTPWIAIDGDHCIKCSKTFGDYSSRLIKCDIILICLDCGYDRFTIHRSCLSDYPVSPRW